MTKISAWESVDSLPPKKTPGYHSDRGNEIALSPGEIRRRLGRTGQASHTRASFKKNGRDALGYKAGERSIDGKLYIYVWREPLV